MRYVAMVSLFGIFLTGCSFRPQQGVEQVQKSISGAIKHAQDETDKMVQPVVDTYTNAKTRAAKAKQGLEKIDAGKQDLIDSIVP